MIQLYSFVNLNIDVSSLDTFTIKTLFKWLKKRIKSVTWPPSNIANVNATW